MDTATLAVSASAAFNASLSTVVSNVCVSDELLPKRPSGSGAAHADILALGDGVSIARVNGSDSLLLVRGDMAVGVITLVAELARPVSFCRVGFAAHLCDPSDG